MNFDFLISILVRTDWAILALWLLLLGAAFAASFGEQVMPDPSSAHFRRRHRR
ncbi:MAG: hypothetical protein JO159_17240 [Acidobacteria bacterium]|nr:hypothetical protein [Acidobacteriota bacterium]